MYTNSPYNGVHTDIRLSNSLKSMPITQFIYGGKKNSYWPIVSFLHIFCTVLSKNMWTVFSSNVRPVSFPKAGEYLVPTPVIKRQ